MKKLSTHLLVFLSICFAYNLNAQLPDGTSAPDWTAVDLDGVTHDMSDMLDDGKHVVLEFSATWCGPCWNFHNTGTLETLNELYGPDGTDQIRVFYVEADLNTNESCMYGSAGCNNNTYGDWVGDHTFPFINLAPNNAPSMASNYAVGFYPTIYAVSANGDNGVYLIGQQTNIGVWEDWFFESFDMALTTSSVVEATCPGEGSIQMSIENGFGNVDYEWSNGATGDFIDGLEPGSYTVTATDSHDYAVSETIVVGGPTDGPLQVEMLDVSDVLCNGETNGSITVSGTGGNGGYSYTWSNGLTGEYIDGLAIGSYTVEIVDSEGCTSMDTYIISEPDFMELTALPEDAECGEATGSVIAFATGGVSPWTYDFGEGESTSGTYTDVAPGDYEMTVTDFNGCISLNSFTINQTEGPDAVAQSDETIDCNTTTVLVSGAGSTDTGDITYEWSTQDGSISSAIDQINVEVAASGTYTLLVTDNATGCSSEVSAVVDADIEAPVTEIASPGVLDCNVSMTTLDASQSTSGDNIVYAWSTTDGNIESGATTQMANVNAAGTYTLLTTNNENGCTSSESVVVTLDNELPTVEVADAELDCSVTETELCATIGMGTSVTWITPDGEVEATCITVSMAGNYMVRALGSNGCESTAEAVVTLSADLPQVSIAEVPTLTCTVPSVMIDAAVEGGVDGLEIEWTSPSGDQINTTDLSVEVMEPGTYTLVVTNTTNGCTTTSSVTVDQVIINPVSAFSTSLDDGTMTLESNSSGDPSSYNWYATINGFSSTSQNTEITFDETGTYEVCLTVLNDCGEDTFCEEVYFVSQLQFETSKLDAPCFGVPEGELSVTPAGGEPGYTISWVGPNGYTSNELSISDLAIGEYSMVLNDSYGYEKSGTFLIAEPTELEESLVEITDETNADGNGSISLEIIGGTGEYTFEWTNGATTAVIEGLEAGEYSAVVTDENGCSKTFGPYNVVSNTVSVSDLDFVSDLSVYPIPANNYLNVDVTLTNAQITQMRVIDAYGKLISTQNFNAKDITARIDVTSMPSGVYYLEFGNKNGKSLEKFVVIK